MGCNLKITKLLECVLIEVYVVIRLNTIYTKINILVHRIRF